MAEVGSAFVSILPSAKNFGSNLTGEVGPELDAAGKTSGGRFSSALGGVLKKTAAGIGLAAGSVLGVALFKGFERLNAIEQAEAKLTGLGHTTKSVDQIMTSALDSVRGTAFGLGEAASVAATTVAAGVEPGKQLARTLKLVADAATIGGTSMGEMGAIFNKVATSNKVQGEVIAQLNDRGIPIIQLLAKELGVTGDEVLEMSRKGEVGFRDFQAAMKAGMGGAALESGDTFTGAWKNLQASLGRIGANLLAGIFPQMTGGIQGITKALEPLEEKAKTVGVAIGKYLGPALAAIVAGLKNLATGNVSTALGGIGASLGQVGAALGAVDWASLKDAMGQGVADTISVFAVVIGFAADHVDTLAKVLPGLVVAYAAYKVAQAASNVVALAALPIQAAHIVSNFALAAANRSLAVQIGITNGVERAGIATRIAGTTATVASTIAATAAAAAARVWAAAQWLLNAALTANPIGIVVVAITALVAALVIAYKKSQTFRNIVNGAFSAVRGVVLAVVGAISRAVSAAWRAITSATKSAWGAVASATRSAWNVIRNTVLVPLRVIVAASKGDMGSVTKIMSSAWKAVSSLTSAAWKGIKGAVTDALNGLVALMKSVPDRIRGALGSLGTILYNAGQELIDGLIRGITAKLSALAAKMSEVANKVKGFLPGSPVKEGPLRSWNNGGAGKRLIDLLAYGLSDTRPIDGAMNRLGSRISVPRPSADLALAGAGGGRSAITITNWRDGTGYMESIADGRLAGQFDLVDEQRRARR